MVLRINTWIAAGNLLIYVHAQLPSDADELLIAEAEGIGASVETSSVADREQSDDELAQLRRELMRAKRQGRIAVEEGSAPLEEGSSAVPLPPGVQTPPSMFNQRIIFDGFGEVEIAASPDGQNIVVGRQSQWVFSNDGGETFPNARNPGRIDAFEGGDPSLAFANSGAFYYAGIDRDCQNSDYPNPPIQPPMDTFGFDCTGIARSTDNGQSFPTRTTNPAVICPLDPNRADRCFPDQEHIAADRVNAGTGGGDQVYSTWRHFLTVTGTEQFARLVCTQDSGVTWTNRTDLIGGFVPRIAVGGDGFVYVVAISAVAYRLWKFSSCANGLVQQGPSVVVLPTDPVVCPFAGHDRCDQNPSSQTVAVDDTNPNHIYFAVADADETPTGAPTPNRDATIFVRDSLDGGLTWRGRVQAHAAVPAPRIMPWICTTGGDAYVTWFDRRSATPCPDGDCPRVQSDATDFFAGRIGLDDEGNLVALGEFRISEVPHPWCGPPNTPWPAPTRQAPGASEACSLQPQLGGQCCQDLLDGMGNPGADGVCDTEPVPRRPCDFSDERDNPGTFCSMGEVCLGGGGVPRYGDYNGNTCIAGRLYAAWPSGTSPPGVPDPDPGTEGILFDAFLVGEVPLVSVPGSVDFGNVCRRRGPFEAPLEVCNTGNENLLVEIITSSSERFNVTAPSSGFPVQISPDFCFPFEVNFTPTNERHTQTATLTISTNDPASPVVEVTAMANCPR